MGGRGGNGGGGAKGKPGIVSRMARLYRQRGASLRSVARATGTSPSTVHRNLTTFGVTLRSRGGQVRGGPTV